MIHARIYLKEHNCERKRIVHFVQSFFPENVSSLSIFFEKKLIIDKKIVT